MNQQQNNCELDESEDPLMKVKNRLLESKENFVSCTERLDCPVQKRVHSEIEDKDEDTLQEQLKKLDEMIEQNYKMLESMTRHKQCQNPAYGTICPENLEDDDVYILSNNPIQTPGNQHEPSQHISTPNAMLNYPQSSQIFLMMNATNENTEIFAMETTRAYFQQNPVVFQTMQYTTIAQPQQPATFQQQQDIIYLDSDDDVLISDGNGNFIEFGALDSEKTGL